MSLSSVVTAALPMLLIAVSFASTVSYHLALQESIAYAETIWTTRGLEFDSSSQILEQTDYTDIPHALILLTVYLIMFLSAAAAFLLRALREYIQDILKLKDKTS